MQACFIFLSYSSFKLNAFDTTGPRLSCESMLALRIPRHYFKYSNVIRKNKNKLRTVVKKVTAILWKRYDDCCNDHTSFFK